ncbi:MAG: ATP-binding protein [Chloroflexota bacterium]
MSESTNKLSLGMVWHRLTEPHSSIREPEQRRRAQLLSQLMLVLIPLGIISTISTGIANSARPQALQLGFVATSLVMIAGMIIAYAFSRTRYYGIGGVIVLGMIYGTTLLLTKVVPTSQNSFLPYLTMIVLLSSMLFSIRYTLLFTILCAAGIVLLPELTPGVAKSTVTNELSYLLLMAALVFVAVRQRDLIEADRRAIRLQIEQALAHERDLLSILMHNIPDAIYYKDIQGHFLRINAAEARLLGINDTDGAIGKTDFDFFSSSHSEQAWEDEQTILRTHMPLVDRLEHFITPDQQEIWVSAAKVPIFDKDGGIMGIVGVSRNITERRTADEALRNSEERLRSLITSMDDLIFSFDLNGHFLFYHQPNGIAGDTPIMRQTHYVGVAIAKLLPPEIAEQFRLAMEDVTRTLSPQSMDYRVQTDNQEYFFSARISPLINASMKLIGVTVVARDVTAAMRAKLHEARFQKLEQINQNVSTLFLESDDYNEVINGTLQIIGTGLDVSGAYVFQFHNFEHLLDHTSEWVAAGAPPVIGDLKGISMDEVMQSLLPLLSTGMVLSKQVDELPADLQTVLKMYSYQSILVVPIYVDTHVQGFIGVGEKRYRRSWLPEEITTIRTISENISRVLERQRVQMALVQARDAALRSAQLKSQFMSNMSHEVRTPMTGVLGMLELLLETPLDETQHEFAETAFSSGHNLLRILDDVLDFSKIEANRVVLEDRVVDLRGFVKEISATLSAQVTKKKLDMKLLVVDDVPEQVVTDPTRLRQILLNLLSNAIKFTQRGSVGIRVRQMSSAQGRSRLRFEVSDTGIGIKAEQLGHIFESFVQADGSTTRRYGGTGLGLAISRQLVQLMGGEIDVQSTVEVGSTFGFTLTLPIAEISPNAATLTAAANGHAALEDAVAKAKRLPSPNPVRLLIADDNSANQQLVMRMLEADGIECDVANDGEAALQLLEHNTYQMILMDIHMPLLDGLATTRRIRALPGSVSTIPVIALTASVLEVEKKTYLDAGMNGLLSKPFSMDELRTCVYHWIGQPS